MQKQVRKSVLSRVLFFYKSLLLTILVSIGSYAAQAQDISFRPIYTTKWGYLYDATGSQAQTLGVFSTEAPLRLLDSTTTHYKVEVSNGDIGYIEKQSLSTRMFGRVSEGEPSSYFYRGPEGHQGPHVYVQAAELRVRNKPSVEGKVVRRARLNEYVSINYYPLYDGAWIYVGDHFHENPGYIPVSFVGKQLSYAQVLRDYLLAKDKDAEQEATLAGRLRELAWSGKPAELLQGLRYYAESTQKLGISNPKIDLAFELRFAEKHQYYLTDFQQYERALRKLKMHYMLQSTPVEDGKISDKQMQTIGLKRVKEIPDVPECGWYPFYFYSNDHVVVAFEENQSKKIVGSVYELKFSSDAAVVLGDQKIDHVYSEDNFVASFGHLLQADWIATPHSYTIMNGDGGFFRFKFENGFAVSFESIYYC